MTKIIFPTDEHYPFQDDKAVELALKITEDFKPDVRICGSDGLDFYNLSSFDRNPDRIKAGTQNDINAWKAGQRKWIDASNKATAYYIMGNHEERLVRYLWNHIEIFDFEALQLQNLLGLEEMGIKHTLGTEYKSTSEFVAGKLLIKHGTFVRSASGATAKAELEHEYHAISVMTGHTHRGGSFYVTSRNGLVQAHECFCLCRLDAEYVSNPNWQQGFAMATVDDDLVSVEMVPFIRRRSSLCAVWRGKEYIA